MVFARLRRRFAEQDWFAVAIELAIVGVGVFLGMQATNWNEARLNRTRAASYRMRLVEDLRATERGARASVAYYRDVRAHALAALAGFDRPAGTLDATFLVDAYQATQQWPRAGRHPTYDEILSSGNAELIGPPALRERLANFYWRMDGLLPQATAPAEYRVRARSLIPYEVQAAIRARCDDVVADDGRGLVTIRLPQDCPIVVPAAQVRAGVAALRDAPGLKADLTGAMTDFDAKLLNFGKLEAAARDMRGILERADR